MMETCETAQMLWWLCYDPQRAPRAGVGSPSRDETSGYDLQSGAGPAAQQGVCGCTQAFTGVVSGQVHGVRLSQSTF